MIGSTWTFHSGQICTAPTRAIVQRGVYDQVVEGLTKMANVLKVGDPYEPDTVLGPVITAAHRDRVESYIASGRAEGAEVVAGGTRPEKPDTGFYVAPTLIAGGRLDMKVVQEEIFGPVIVVLPFDDEDEGIALMNGTDFGLYDYVFSADTNKAFRATQAAAGRQHRHQHDPAQSQHAVRWHQVQRRRARRWRVRAARVQRPPVGRLARLMTTGSQTASSTVSVVPDGVLAYGMQLPVQALSVRVSMPWEQEATVADMVRVAQAADEAGFLYVAVCHHVALPHEAAEMMSTQWFDPIATLGYLAAHTTRTRLMTNVFIAAYQPPLTVSKAFATLDRLSGGRMILGIGAGHAEGEFDALGVSFADRGKLTDAALAVIADALTNEWTTAAVGRRGRPAPAPGAAAASADLDRWLGQARAAARRDDGRRLDPAGHPARPTPFRHRDDPARARPSAPGRGAGDRLPPRRARR